MFFTITLGLYFVRLLIFELQAPEYLRTLESNIWIFFVLGFGYKNLNHAEKPLTYLSQATFPVYIIHMFFLYAMSYIILPLPISFVAKFIFIIALTFIGCYNNFELIKRSKIVRPLFRIKSLQKK